MNERKRKGKKRKRRREKERKREREKERKREREKERKKERKKGGKKKKEKPVHSSIQFGQLTRLAPVREKNKKKLINKHQLKSQYQQKFVATPKSFVLIAIYHDVVLLNELTP